MEMRGIIDHRLVDLSGGRTSNNNEIRYSVFGERCACKSRKVARKRDKKEYYPSGFMMALAIWLSVGPTGWYDKMGISHSCMPL